jgi:hypothetical protein
MFQQGRMSFALNHRGKGMVGWVDLCPECGEPAPEPHHHLRADLEVIIQELKRVALPNSAKQTHDPVGEHLTLKELARYAKRSTRWLSDRTKDTTDPLPCEKPKGGKMTFRRSDFDKWIGRQRPDAIVGIVSDVMNRLERGSR